MFVRKSLVLLLKACTSFSKMPVIPFYKRLNILDGNPVANMNEDDRSLGYYCPHEGYTIHCIDLDPNSITKELEDLSQVEKYMISEEDYDKLPDTFRKFKERLLKANPDLVKTKKQEPKGEDYMKEEAMNLSVIFKF